MTTKKSLEIDAIPPIHARHAGGRGGGFVSDDGLVEANARIAGAEGAVNRPFKSEAE